MNAHTTTLLTIIVAAVAFTGVLLGLALYPDNYVALTLTAFVFYGLALLIGFFFNELRNVLSGAGSRMIGIYPLSFVQNDGLRRTLLVVATPLIMLTAILWYFIPMAESIRREIFRYGFWNAVINAYRTTWTRTVSPNEVFIFY